MVIWNYTCQTLERLGFITFAGQDLVGLTSWSRESKDWGQPSFSHLRRRLEIPLKHEMHRVAKGFNQRRASLEGRVSDLRKGDKDTKCDNIDKVVKEA